MVNTVAYCTVVFYNTNVNSNHNNTVLYSTVQYSTLIHTWCDCEMTRRDETREDIHVLYSAGLNPFKFKITMVRYVTLSSIVISHHAVGYVV